MVAFVQAHAPWPWLASLLVGEYGLWTMGMTYAIALVLPIVTTFFLAFGFLEDSGYFARLSVIANRGFARIGLNGRAVLPMVLGLGCVTMATLTTRILTTRRERVIATFLMALAIPCSAQLGVVMGMLGGLGLAWVAGWAGVLVGVIVLAGFLAAKLIPGKRIPLVTEMPPLRWPVAANVLKKTGGRLALVPARGDPALPHRHLRDVGARRHRRAALDHRARRAAGHRLAGAAQGSGGGVRDGLPAARLRRDRAVRDGRSTHPPGRCWSAWSRSRCSCRASPAC